MVLVTTKPSITTDRFGFGMSDFRTSKRCLSCF